MRRKVTLTIIIFLIFTISIILIYPKEEKEIMDNNEETKNNFISMMVENDNGEYEEKTDITFPKENYIFNPEASGCENDGKLSWNKEKGKIEASLVTSDKCYAYFDKYDFTKSCLFGYEDNLSCELIKNKNNTLIYHDGKCDYEGEENCDLEADDYSYRFSGSYENVHNFVCLDGISQTGKCQNNDGNIGDENLYRIIGLFKNDANKYEIKLIKYDYATEVELGGNDLNNSALSTSKYTTSSNPKYHGSLATIPGYYWNNLSNVNTWNESNLNNVNLNDFYFNYLTNKINNINIVNHSWKVGSSPSSDVRQSNAKITYNTEIKNNSLSLNNLKIGLMYVSDYYYAANSKYWNLVGYNENYSETEKDYRDTINDNWIFMSFAYEWTISPDSSANFRAYCIDEIGTVGNGNYVSRYGYIVRPVFYLSDSTNILYGNGTKETPYRLSF